MEIGVSIHAPARGATCLECYVLGSGYGFNPRTRTGCDTIRLKVDKEKRSFNPRTRTGCDVGYARYSTDRQTFQSTHPHGVRRWLCPLQHRQADVSIHAPARGATIYTEEVEAAIEVSIHAPARGATLDIIRTLQEHYVSIHAPARGATRGSRPLVSISNGFNPRTRTGCDIHL